MENSAYECEEFECEKTNIKLQKIMFRNAPKRLQNNILVNGDNEYYISEEVLETVKILLV